MKGQIIKISSDLHYVSYDGKIYPCKCRGLFRKKHILPVVGDYVFFNLEKKIIEDILPRKNYFQRPKVSNIDQAFLVTSLKVPDFSLNLLDKFISLMEMNDVKPIICITKKDLMNDNELKSIEDILAYYQKIGYQVVYNDQVDDIKKLLVGKSSVFTGQTGAGKSTLLNRIQPDWNLEVGEVSLALGRGKHTTRVVELFEFQGGKVFDTPGFSSLDLKDYSLESIRDSFIEFQNYPCVYKDCMHTKEGECCVKKAVSNHEILESRYQNYLDFIKEGFYES